MATQREDVVLPAKANGSKSIQFTLIKKQIRATHSNKTTSYEEATLNSKQRDLLLYAALTHRVISQVFTLF